MSAVIPYTATVIEIESLSKATGRRILAKAEYMNPGGSVKDRAALWLIEAAEREGRLIPGKGMYVCVCVWGEGVVRGGRHAVLAPSREVCGRCCDVMLSTHQSIKLKFPTPQTNPCSSMHCTGLW